MTAVALFPGSPTNKEGKSLVHFITCVKGRQYLITWVGLARNTHMFKRKDLDSAVMNLKL